MKTELLFLGNTIREAETVKRIRLIHVVMASVCSVTFGFYAGQIYNAKRQLDSVGLPAGKSVVREYGQYVSPYDHALRMSALK